MNIEELRSICLSLPGTTEDVKWGADLVFMVGGRMFCVTSTEPPHNISLKVNDEDFEELSTAAGMIPAPYMARAKWVQVQKHSVWNKKEWERRIKEAHALVAAKLTKKQRTELGL
jgi:predicted DNA-binding protein (MmcQ/YjbR family)